MKVLAVSSWGVLKTSRVVPGGHDHGLVASYELVLDPWRLASPGTDTLQGMGSTLIRKTVPLDNSARTLSTESV